MNNLDESRYLQNKHTKTLLKNLRLSGESWLANDEYTQKYLVPAILLILKKRKVI